MKTTLKVGLTLPTFSDDVGPLVAVAQAAEAVGLDAVFTYDHLYRVGSGGQGPALSLEPVLGALAAETSTITFGSFMARASLRPPATLATVLETVARIAPGRLIAGIGAGDALSDPEQHMFGLSEGDIAVRLGALEATVTAVKEKGVAPVWVGGKWEPVLAVAAACADGWNSWNVSLEAFERELGHLRRACEAAGRPAEQVTPTWGGLVELRPDRWEDAAARPDVLSGGWDGIAAAARAYADAGAEWIVFAPLAPADPANATVLAEEIVPRLRLSD